MTDTPSAQQRLGREAMDFADYLQNKYGEFTLGNVIVVADVLVADGENVVNAIEWNASDPRRWVQQALLKEAHELAEAHNARREEQQLESES